MDISETDVSRGMTPATFLIMLALAEGDRHGYAIMQEADQLTGGAARLGPGTLYRSIQRMRVEGWIEEQGEAVGLGAEDERRRVYRLTGKGYLVARAEARRLRTLVEAARERRLLPRSRSKREKSLARKGRG